MRTPVPVPTVVEFYQSEKGLNSRLRGRKLDQNGSSERIRDASPTSRNGGVLTVRERAFDSAGVSLFDSKTGGKQERGGNKKTARVAGVCCYGKHIRTSHGTSITITAHMV